MKFYEWFDRNVIDLFRTESAYEDIREQEQPKEYVKPSITDPYPKLSRIKMKDIEDFYQAMNRALRTAIEMIDDGPGNPDLATNRNAMAKNLRASYNHIRSAKCYHHQGKYRMAIVEVGELKQLLSVTKALNENYPLDVNYLPDRVINSQIASLSLILNNWLFD